MGLLFHFLAKHRVNLHKSGDDEGHGAASHDDKEESFVAYSLLESASKESRNHHRERHESSAKSVMRRLVVAPTIIYKVEHIGSKAKTIAELLDKDADIDDKETGRQCVCQIDIYHVRQSDGADHEPKPFLQSVSSSADATENEIG